ncbi:hypothetical protein RI367_001855 [Sorochytrium milnesiophthora]
MLQIRLDYGAVELAMTPPDVLSDRWVCAAYGAHSRRRQNKADRQVLSSDKDEVDALVERIRKHTESNDDVDGFMVVLPPGGMRVQGSNYRNLELLHQALRDDYARMYVLHATCPPDTSQRGCLRHLDTVICNGILQRYSDGVVCFTGSYDGEQAMSAEEMMHAALPNILAPTDDNLSGTSRAFFSGWDLITHLFPLSACKFAGCVDSGPHKAISTDSVFRAAAKRMTAYTSAIDQRCLAATCYLRGTGAVPKLSLQRLERLAVEKLKITTDNDVPVDIRISKEAAAPNASSLTLLHNSTSLIREVVVGPLLGLEKQQFVHAYRSVRAENIRTGLLDEYKQSLWDVAEAYGIYI